MKLDPTDIIEIRALSYPDNPVVRNNDLAAVLALRWPWLESNGSPCGEGGMASKGRTAATLTEHCPVYSNSLERFRSRKTDTLP